MSPRQVVNVAARACFIKCMAMMYTKYLLVQGLKRHRRQTRSISVHFISHLTRSASGVLFRNTYSI